MAVSAGESDQPAEVKGQPLATTDQGGPYDSQLENAELIESGDEVEDWDGHGLTQNPPSQPHQPSQKKRADYANFGNWLERNRDRISKMTELTHADDEQSTAYMFRAEQQKIIESPRDYQIELFERAKQKNIIAVLDTGELRHSVLVSSANSSRLPGSGKTLIAAMLLEHTIGEELERRATGEPKRVSFFLVCVFLCSTKHG